MEVSDGQEGRGKKEIEHYFGWGEVRLEEGGELMEDCREGKGEGDLDVGDKAACVRAGGRVCKG